MGVPWMLLRKTRWVRDQRKLPSVGRRQSGVTPTPPISPVPYLLRPQGLKMLEWTPELPLNIHTQSRVFNPSTRGKIQPWNLECPQNITPNIQCTLKRTRLAIKRKGGQSPEIQAAKV